MPETLKGLIERVTYHNPENGFAVLKVKVKGLPGRTSGDTIPNSGSLLSSAPVSVALTCCPASAWVNRLAIAYRITPL